MLPSWSSITCTIDLEAPGRRTGVVRLPLPGGTEVVETPIAVFVRGSGPTVLMTGAVHGDEYDGPLALSGLVRDLRLETINGRLIVIPFLNKMALRAGQRASPLDRLDLNRSFPGRPDGTPTEMLAHWVATRLVPLVDVVIDSHTGGGATRWVPLVMFHPLTDKEQRRRTIALVQAMRPPVGVELNESDKPGMFDSFVEQQGKVFVCCEFGGGTLTGASLDVARTCLSNALIYLGMLDGAPETPVWPGLDRPRLMHMPSLDWTLSAQVEGVFEPLVEPGRTVRSGEVLGLIHSTSDVDSPPSPVRAPLEGVLLYRPALNTVAVGRRLAMIAQDLAVEPQ